LRRLRAVALRDEGVGGRVPALGVDAVEDADEIAGARRDEPLQSAAELRRGQLARIARADRSQAIGIADRRLEEGELAVELHRVGPAHLVGQAQALDEPERKAALERRVVDGEHGARPRARGRENVARARHEIRHESGVPVVAVHDVGAPAGGVGRQRKAGDRMAEDAEAHRVVGPVATELVLVGRAWAAVERRAIEQPDREAGIGRALQQAHRRDAHHGVEVGRDASPAQRLERRLVAGKEQAYFRAQARQRAGKRGAHVREAAGLGKRIDLRCGEQDAHESRG
jgi:hypothetical protein